MERGDLSVLLQLVDKIGVELSEMETAYQNRNFQRFNDAKKNILRIQEEIDGGFNGE